VDYFISYGDQKYSNSKIRISNESKLFGFHETNVYSREYLPEEFLKKTFPYINHERGGGYWLWKSFFLKETFDKMNFGDFCVYADAGCTINPNGKERFEYYKKLLSENDYGILSFRMDGLDEESYTTEEIFKNFGVEENSDIRKSGQIMATILVMCKTKNSQKLVDDYYKLAVTRPNLFSDDFNYSNNCQMFVDNRHDQSILSVMRKKYGSIEILDETYADSMDGWNNLYYVKNIPFLATRIRN
jgi:hypothetical protein